MLVAKANGDKVTVLVRADSIDCPELHPSDGMVDSQCWIALKSGQVITVAVELELVASQYQVDLVIDGVVRNIKTTTVTPKNGERKATFEFIEGISYLQRSLHRSPMITSRIETNQEKLQNGLELIQYMDNDQTSVGTIEIFVYIFKDGFNHLRHAAAPEDVKDWEDLPYAPGTAGVQPTHEIVYDADQGVKLNDTQRRSWRKKEGRPCMGPGSFAQFKYLYRHESVLREKDIIDPHRNILATTDHATALATGFKQLNANGGPVSASLRKTNNPFRVAETDGIREYKTVVLTPERPGPQPNIALEYHAGKKRNRRARRQAESESDSEEEYTPARASPRARGGSQRPQTKQKTDDDLRKKIANKKAALEKARVDEETEKDKLERMQQDFEEEIETDATREADLDAQFQESIDRKKLYVAAQDEIRNRLPVSRLLSRAETPAAQRPGFAVASGAVAHNKSKVVDKVAVQNEHGHPTTPSRAWATVNDKANTPDVDEGPTVAHAPNDNGVPGTRVHFDPEHGPANAVNAWDVDAPATPTSNSA